MIWFYVFLGICSQSGLHDIGIMVEFFDNWVLSEDSFWDDLIVG